MTLPLAIEHATCLWLSRMALDSGDQGALVGGFAARLLEAGLPLVRLGLGYQAFHPVLQGRGVAWRRGPPPEIAENARSATDADALAESPFQLIARGEATEVRRTVGTSHVPGEFPLLDRYVAEGTRDYLGLAVGFGAGSTVGALRGVMLSFQTDRTGGFTADEVAALRRLAIPYAHAVKTMLSVDAARVLVTTYLGRDPGQRVLDGTIRRGATATTQAVLWSSDLVGFTRIADTVPQAALVPLLNDYADAVVGAITGAGGEVLKFIGDGILAIFPLAEPGAGPRALDAAVSALAAVRAVSDRRAAAGQPRTGLHLALHVGEVLYGNIGSRERLDFTVVGRAVNELARIEAMCRSLDQPFVASEAFSALVPPGRLVSLGRYALRGVRQPQALFTLETRAAAPEDRRGGR